MHLVRLNGLFLQIFFQVSQQVKKDCSINTLHCLIADVPEVIKDLLSSCSNRKSLAKFQSEKLQQFLQQNRKEAENDKRYSLKQKSRILMQLII